MNTAATDQEMFDAFTLLGQSPDEFDTPSFLAYDPTSSDNLTDAGIIHLVEERFAKSAAQWRKVEAEHQEWLASMEEDMKSISSVSSLRDRIIALPPDRTHPDYWNGRYNFDGPKLTDEEISAKIAEAKADRAAAWARVERGELRL